MTNRTVFLSGYPTNSLTGRIDIDPSLMRDAADRCTCERRWSWADVRMLDDGFRLAIQTTSKAMMNWLAMRWRVWTKWSARVDFCGAHAETRRRIEVEPAHKK
jgi:hypothetical protein